MKFRDIGYALGCMLVVFGLLFINPNFRAQQTAHVNTELLEQAEEQGLLNAKMPAGAKSVVENGCEVYGIVTGEITFELNDVSWTYHCAPAEVDADEVPDISDVEGSFKALDTKVQHCPAVVSVSDDGVGKIVWYDPVAGVAYSLSMAENANGDTLQSIANFMYNPMQGNS